MNIVLFDSQSTRLNLLPFTYTRPVADIRVGILTLREKWERYTGSGTYTLTESYLHEKFPYVKADDTATVFINGAVFPSHELVKAIHSLGALQVLVSGEKVLAFKGPSTHLNYENAEAIARGYTRIEFSQPYTAIEHLWDIFKKNGQALEADFELLTRGRPSQPLSKSNVVIGSADRIFLEPGAKAEACIFNTSTGPVYLGADAEVMEGSVIRGPLALGEHAVLKMAAKVYGPTTLGPHCKAGGELNNVVMFGYSNKAHDGFVGNAVIGEWCNLGADSNNSNLKNNYANVDVFSYAQGKSIDTGLQFCGLFMGDHSKCGINTMFNTGTVVGVSANVFGGDFPPKFIPSFSWGGAQWLRTFSFEKSLEVAARVMERRGLTLTGADINILQTVFERDKKFRKS